MNGTVCVVCVGACAVCRCECEMFVWLCVVYVMSVWCIFGVCVCACAWSVMYECYIHSSYVCVV